MHLTLNCFCNENESSADADGSLTHLSALSPELEDGLRGIRIDEEQSPASVQEEIPARDADQEFLDELLGNTSGNIDQGAGDFHGHSCQYSWPLVCMLGGI